MYFDFDKEFTDAMTYSNSMHVVVLGHENPDGDAAGSVLGISHYIADNYPEYQVHPYIGSNLDIGPKQMLLGDEVFRPLDPIVLPENRSYVVIVCDTSKEDRIAGKEWLENASDSIVLDHHEVNKGYGKRNHIRYYSSCAEVITEILSVDKISKKTAQYLYMGIIQDTKIFKKIYGDLTMKLAGKLLSKEIDHEEIIKTFNVTTVDDYVKEASLVTKVERYADNRIACLLVDKAYADQQNIMWNHAKKVINDFQGLEDVEIAIVFYERRENEWRIACRADGVTRDAIKYIHAYGGGGHPYAAGLILQTEEIGKYKEEIIQLMRKDIEAD